MLPKRKTLYIQKFGCAGFLLIVMIFVFDRPRVSLFSKTEFSFREQKTENFTSFDEIVKHEKDQTRNIQLLKAEVEKLREELD